MLPAFVSAQDDSLISLDLLRVPSSPGFTILGVEPADIERPTDPNDFAISILNATNNLSLLPKNYSLEFAPGWIFFGNNIRYEDFKNNKVGNNLLQSLMISLAVVTEDIDSNTQRTKMGFGFKVSLFRGEFDEEFQKYDDKRNEKLSYYNTLLSQELKEIKDTIYKQLEDSLRRVRKMYQDNQDPSLNEYYLKTLKGITEAMQFRAERFKSETVEKISKEKKNLLDSLKQLTSEIKFDRYGFKLDFAGGLALDFPDRRLNYSKVMRAGLWITTGYESMYKWSILCAGKFLASPDKEITENNTIIKKNVYNLDLGVRAIVDKIKNFSLSFEYIYRKYFNTGDNPSKFKYDLSLGYELGKNKILTFSIGRNFEGITTTGGNLIAALNLVLGFGSKRI